MSRYICMDGPIDPPNDEEPTYCATCATSGTVCSWCERPIRAGEGAIHLDAVPTLCDCPVRPTDDLITQLELLGYVQQYMHRAEKCGKCEGWGNA